MMLNEVAGDRSINITAVTASVLLHMILFTQLMNSNMSGHAQAPNYSTRISLNMLAPSKQPPQLVKADIPLPEPVHKPKPKLKSKPIPKPKLQTKPEIAKPVPVVVPEQAVAPIVAQKIQRAQVNNSAPIRKRYLNNLLTYIEGNKYYPKAARFRGVEGVIEVSFQLLDDGYINDLKTLGGPLILRKAAEQAVARALPFPVPPSEVNCPLQVSYAMQFHLN